MFTLNKKKPIKHIPGQIKEALVREVSAVDYPANGIPFIYVKSQEAKKMDEELRKALMQMGFIPTETEAAEAAGEPEALQPDLMDALTKSAEAFGCVQDLIEADTEGTVDNELEKAGVKKDIQRPALLQLMASLHGKIGEYLDKAGYDKKKQKMSKAEGEAPADEAAPEAPVQKGAEMTPEEIQALITKSVAEALAQAPQPAAEQKPEGDEAAPAENPLQKTLEDLTGRFETLTKAVDEADQQTEEIQKQHETEKEVLEKQISTLTEGIAALEKKLAVRAPNSALLMPEGAPPPKAHQTPIQKQQSTWANTPVADFASEVRQKN